jgi:hypothetical protein
MTDSIYNQVAAEAGACTAAILTNQACSPTVQEIKTLGANEQCIVWTPSQPNSSGNATWPQAYGNQVPFTSGMWIFAARSLTGRWRAPSARASTPRASATSRSPVELLTFLAASPLRTDGDAAAARQIGSCWSDAGKDASQVGQGDTAGKLDIGCMIGIEPAVDEPAWLARCAST